MYKVFYHAHCMDGLGAAWAVWKKLGSIDAEYFPIGYETQLKTDSLHGTDVLAVDFSFKAPVVEELVNITRSVTVIDHHKTALQETDKYSKFLRKGRDQVIFDMSKSGAVLAWEYLYPNLEVPELLKYIQDRDLWEWKLPWSKEISAWLMCQTIQIPQDMEAFVAEFRESKDVYIQIGHTVLKSNDKMVDRILLTQSSTKLLGHDAVAVQSSVLMSEAGNKLLEVNPGINVAIIWYADKDMVKFSLRGNGKVDVAELAKNFGGGGHAKAAGFEIKGPNGSSLISDLLR